MILAKFRSEFRFVLAKASAVGFGFLLSILVYPVDLRLAQTILLFDGLRPLAAPLDSAIQQADRAQLRAKLTATKGLFYSLILVATIALHPHWATAILGLGYGLFHFLTSQYAAHVFRSRRPWASSLASLRGALASRRPPIEGLSSLGLLCVTSAFGAWAYVTLYGVLGTEQANFLAMRWMDVVLFIQAIAAQRLIAFGKFDRLCAAFFVLGLAMMGAEFFHDPFFAVWGIAKLLSLYVCAWAFANRRIVLIAANQVFLSFVYHYVAQAGFGETDAAILIASEALSLLSFFVVMAYQKFESKNAAKTEALQARRTLTFL